MFPEQCFLVCPELKLGFIVYVYFHKIGINRRIILVGTFWPVNLIFWLIETLIWLFSIKIGGDVELPSDLSVYFLFYGISV